VIGFYGLSFDQGCGVGVRVGKGVIVGTGVAVALAGRGEKETARLKIIDRTTIMLKIQKMRWNLDLLRLTFSPHTGFLWCFSSDL
jgi:hypothetical protein